MKRFKELLVQCFYLLGAIGLIDMIVNLFSRGEVRIIHTVLEFVF